MKKVLSIILLTLSVLLLASCKNTDNNTDSKSDDSYYFTAKIIEQTSSSLLLEVTDQGSSGLNKGSQAYISVKQDYPNTKVGESIKVEFDGVILETYPCQLPNIYSVTKVNN